MKELKTRLNIFLHNIEVTQLKFRRLTARQRQAIFRKLAKKTVKTISFLIVMIVITKITWYWSFERPNARDSFEANNYQVVETKNEP